jgi:hypothetical protein
VGPVLRRGGRRAEGSAYRGSWARWGMHAVAACLMIEQPAFDAVIDIGCLHCLPAADAPGESAWLCCWQGHGLARQLQHAVLAQQQAMTASGSMSCWHLPWYTTAAPQHCSRRPLGASPVPDAKNITARSVRPDSTPLKTVLLSSMPALHWLMLTT